MHLDGVVLEEYVVFYLGSTCFVRSTFYTTISLNLFSKTNTFHLVLQKFHFRATQDFCYVSILRSREISLISVLQQISGKNPGKKVARKTERLPIN
jgi:hypothetical protein